MKKIEQWEHDIENPETGECVGGGAVHTKGGIRYSHKSGGCNLPKCNCSEGHWVCFSMPIDINNKVKGFTVYFDNEEERSTFIRILEYRDNPGVLQ